jgi:TonB family protein
MNEKLDPKEAKILADILALTLDDQPGASLTALQKIQQRARQDGITGGALKNIFSRVASDLPRQGERGDGAGPSSSSPFNATQLRSTIAAQAASISLLEQRVALLQARLSQNEASRRQEHQAMMWSARRLGIKTALCGLLIGGLLVGLVAYALPAPPQFSGSAQMAAPGVASLSASGPVAAQRRQASQAPGNSGIEQAVDPGFSPPARDPMDTAPGPEYPPDAARRGIEGMVQLLVYVEKDGHVGGIAVAHGSGAPDLDVAAEQAVRQWHFLPAMRNGEPVATSTNVTLRFVLHR